MFELEKTPHHLSYTGNNSICIVSAYNETQSEITDLLLPEKSSEKDLLSYNSDLKLKCGTFTESVVTQVSDSILNII